LNSLELLAIAAAYLIGAIPFGLLFARILTGKDPREHGSGNIGATNALRTSGKAVGAMTLLADIFKGSIPVAIAIAMEAGEATVAAIAMAAFLGHIFPVYLGFKGGKGVATMFGVVIPWLPWAAVGSFLVWFIIFKLTRLVALASIAAGVALPVTAWLLYGSWVSVVTCALFALIMIVRHHSNIRRMLAGEEPKTGLDREE